MRFSREEYRSGLPFPPPGDLPNPGIEPTSVIASALAGGFFTTEPPVKHLWEGRKYNFKSSQVALVVKNPPANEGDIKGIPGLGKIPWRRE